MGDKIATLLPARARQVIYTVIGTATLLEAIWDIVPEPLEGNILKTLQVLGFGLAVTQTKKG